MSTSLPQVVVTRVDLVYLVACDCGHKALRLTRYEAVQHATHHRRVHASGEAV